MSDMPPIPVDIVAVLQTRVAFSIPAKHMVEDRYPPYGKKYPDRLVSGLLSLFEDSKFEDGSLCAPVLLVNTQTPGLLWTVWAIGRINEFLSNYKP